MGVKKKFEKNTKNRFQEFRQQTKTYSNGSLYRIFKTQITDLKPAKVLLAGMEMLSSPLPADLTIEYDENNQIRQTMYNPCNVETANDDTNDSNRSDVIIVVLKINK